jgi:glycosyltransferase involved in cell wall biosynthesis
MEKSLIMNSSLLVVIPAFNEEAVLGRTLDALLQEVSSNQVLVVSDGSTDKTSQIVNDKKIKLLEIPFNLGVGAAMRSGFQFAKENGFQKVIQFDADLQHQPKYIKKIVSELDKYDVVVGSRFAAKSTYKVSFVRSLAMGLLKESVTRHIGKKMTDVTSGFRGANKKAIEIFADHYPSEYLADTVESLIMAHDKGLTIGEIPVTMQERQGGMPSQNIYRSTLYLFRSILVIIATLTVKPRKDK